MRLPRLSEGVVRRTSAWAGPARAEVRLLEAVCVVQRCNSDSDCSADPACPYCVNQLCKANQDDACRPR